jgi:hypothetical protein
MQETIVSVTRHPSRHGQRENEGDEETMAHGREREIGRVISPQQFRNQKRERQ